LLLYASHLPLGVPNGRVLTTRQQAAERKFGSWRVSRRKRQRRR
jgi:hypothetical protein